MPLTPVTNPDLLAQLNNPQGLSPITDPSLLAQLNGQSQPVGTGEAAATGLMSGIPLGETAASAFKMLQQHMSYSQAHQALEDLKDAAWQQHPVAYGAGKVAGLGATGLVAPEGIPGAIAAGAGYGVDTAATPGAIPQAAAVGAGTGAIGGAIGEKVISPLISKGIPAVAKGALSILGPSTEDIEAKLANPEAISNAVGNVPAADKLAQALNDLKTQADALSEKARGLLSPDKTVLTAPTPETEPTAAEKLMPQATTPKATDTVTPVINDVKQRLVGATGGAPASAEQQTALNSLDAQLQRLQDIAKTNNGQIPETELESVVKRLQQSIAPSQWDTPDVSASKGAMRQVAGSLNGLLKQSNPEYGQAMVPVAALRSVLQDASDTFSVDQNAQGVFQPTDATNTRMGNILNENKSNAQQVLQHISDLTGYDFLGNAKNFQTQQAFAPNAGGGSELKNALTMLGYAGGHMTGIPGGGILGAATGRIVGAHIDGGAIASRILDSYISGRSAFTGSEAGQALNTFGPILVNAAKQGGNQLAATHFVLATSNPQYQDLMQKVQDNTNDLNGTSVQKSLSLPAKPHGIPIE